VFVRVAPNKGAPSCGTPAYNSKNVGILYDVDEQHRDEDTGDIWYHIRGMGWSMAKFFVIYSADQQTEQDECKRWLVGLTREEVERCLSYLENALNDEGVD
jgi:hypothetical protein